MGDAESWQVSAFDLSFPVMKQDTDLTTLNISLPRQQREFVESEAAKSGCTTTSEYVRRLINDAQRRTAQEELDRKLLAGLDSGASIAITPEYWEKKRREIVQRHGRKPRKKS